MLDGQIRIPTDHVSSAKGVVGGRPDGLLSAEPGGWVAGYLLAFSLPKSGSAIAVAVVVLSRVLAASAGRNASRRYTIDGNRLRVCVIKSLWHPNKRASRTPSSHESDGRSIRQQDFHHSESRLGLMRTWSPAKVVAEGFFDIEVWEGTRGESAKT